MITDCKAGNVFLVDFDEMGFAVPEMVKRRMVAVVSPRRIDHKRGLATVVALSATAPREKELHVVPLEKTYYWSSGGLQLWAKCDMIYTFGFERLEHLVAYSTQIDRGQNHHPVPQLTKADLRNIRFGLSYAVGLEEHLEPRGRRDYSRLMRGLYRGVWRKRLH
jgi:uncharacterized protein YifN (PemK superfamily)